MLILHRDLRSPLKDTLGAILVPSGFLSIVCFLWNARQVLHDGTPGTVCSNPPCLGAVQGATGQGATVQGATETEYLTSPGVGQKNNLWSHGLLLELKKSRKDVQFYSAESDDHRFVSEAVNTL